MGPVSKRGALEEKMPLETWGLFAKVRGLAVSITIAILAVVMVVTVSGCGSNDWTNTPITTLTKSVRLPGVSFKTAPTASTMEGLIQGNGEVTTKYMDLKYIDPKNKSVSSSSIYGFDAHLYTYKNGETKDIGAYISSRGSEDGSKEMDSREFKPDQFKEIGKRGDNRITFYEDVNGEGKWIVLGYDSESGAGFSIIIKARSEEKDSPNTFIDFTTLQFSPSAIEYDYGTAHDKHYKAEREKASEDLKNSSASSSSSGGKSPKESSDDDWAKEVLERQYGTSDPDKIELYKKRDAQKAEDFYDRYGYYPG